MVEAPMISIITPFFNSDKFIEQAIESVLAQTHREWELLLVDDGSCDRSAAIAKRYAAAYPRRVRCLAHDGLRNLGQSASRNLGIRHASGDYLAFLDADDVFLPRKLERQVAILEAHPQAGMVYGPSYYWYGWTEDPQVARRDHEAPLGVQPGMLHNRATLLTAWSRNGATVPCTCALLARRSVVDAINGFEDVVHGMYEDQTFLVKMCIEAPVFVDAQCHDRYRQHSDSISSRAIEQRHYHPSNLNPAQLAFLNWLQQYLSERRIEERALWKAYRRALWPYRHPYLYSLRLTARRAARGIARRLVEFRAGLKRRPA